MLLLFSEEEHKSNVENENFTPSATSHSSNVRSNQPSCLIAGENGACSAAAVTAHGASEHLWFPEWIPPSGTAGLLPNNEASPKHHIRVCMSGLMWRMGGIYQRVDSAFCFIQPSWWGKLKDTQGENHTTGTHLHKKGSMLISRAEQGMFSSNLVITSG